MLSILRPSSNACLYLFAMLRSNLWIFTSRKVLYHWVPYSTFPNCLNSLNQATVCLSVWHLKSKEFPYDDRGLRCVTCHISFLIHGLVESMNNDPLLVPVLANSMKIQVTNIWELSQPRLSSIQASTGITFTWEGLYNKVLFTKTRMQARSSVWVLVCWFLPSSTSLDHFSMSVFMCFESNVQCANSI